MSVDDARGLRGGWGNLRLLLVVVPWLLFSDFSSDGDFSSPVKSILLSRICLVWNF